MKTLEQFVLELRDDMDRFQNHWRDQHKKHPEQWPMEFPDEDAGSWWEQFVAFIDQGR